MTSGFIDKFKIMSPRIPNVTNKHSSSTEFNELASLFTETLTFGYRYLFCFMLLRFKFFVASTRSVTVPMKPLLHVGHVA